MKLNYISLAAPISRLKRLLVHLSWFMIPIRCGKKVKKCARFKDLNLTSNHSSSKKFKFIPCFLSFGTSTTSHLNDLKFPGCRCKYIAWEKHCSFSQLEHLELLQFVISRFHKTTLKKICNHLRPVKKMSFEADTLHIPETSRCPHLYIRPVYSFYLSWKMLIGTHD